jgi:hypothetical protein
MAHSLTLGCIVDRLQHTRPQCKKPQAAHTRENSACGTEDVNHALECSLTGRCDVGLAGQAHEVGAGRKGHGALLRTHCDDATCFARRFAKV